MSNKGQHPDSELCGGDSDDMLRRRFSVLRREEAQHTPEFATLWKARLGARRKVRWLVATACALIAFLAFLWMRPTQRRPDDKTVASITEWKAPTDFLLETPGRELLRTVPEIGQWHVYAATPGATPSPSGKKVLQ